MYIGVQMGIEVMRWDAGKDGELTKENMVKKMEKMGFKCAHYTFEAGKVFHEHTHEETKIDAIFSGEFEVGMDGETAKLGPGDMVLIASNKPHTARVLGSAKVELIDGSK
jgi:quercetin dioxygenase-like cupin family protein